MNSLVSALLVATLCSACVSAGLVRYDNVHPSLRLKRSATATISTPVDSETSASHHGWTALGYNGPQAAPEVRADGTIADTPEVAAARIAHLAALETARTTNPDTDDGHYDPHKYGDHLYGVVPHSEDISNSILMYNSLAKGHHVASEVTAAKAYEAVSIQTAAAKAQEAAHSQAKASAEAEAALALWKAKNAAAGGYSYAAPVEQNKPYFGPLAMLQVLPTGYLADTLEVAAAKKTHLSALAEAQAAEALWKAKHAQTQTHPWN